MCRPSHLLWPVVLLVLLLLACSCSEAREISIDEHSTISNKMSLSAAQANAAAIARAFATAESGDTVVVPANNVYYALGGIKLWNKHHLTIRIEGKVVAYEDFKHWPRAIKEGGGTYDNFIDIRNCTHIHMHGAGDAAPTFKEIEKAYHFGKKNKKSVAYIGSVIDGRGLAWWNKWIIDPILGKKLPHRPKLIGFKNCTDLLLEKFTCVNSPSYHVLLADVARVEVNNVNIFVDRALKTAVKTKINLIQYLQSRNGEDGEAGTGDQWMVDHPKVRAIFDAMAEIERDAKTQQSLLTMSDSLEATRTEDGFAALLKSDKYPGIQAQVRACVLLCACTMHQDV